jgi:hypothetical protein
MSRWGPLALALAAAGPCAADAGLQAGAAATDITPPTGFPMWGYAARHDAPCEGIRDRLRARSLVLQAANRRIAIVSLDLGRAPTRDSTRAIRDRVRQAAGIETVILVGSHTHHGPVLEIARWPSPQTSYVHDLERRLGDLILAAAKDLRQARVGVASKEVPFNRNRQSRRPDAPVDRSLRVLRVEDQGGRPIAHLVNFAAHPTMLAASLRQYSADYPGAMAALVEKRTGAPCLFLQGAAGDLSPNAAGGDSPEQFGQALGREVLTLARSIHTAAPEKSSLQAYEEDFTFHSRVDVSNPLLRLALGQAFFPELVSFYEREYRGGVRPHLVVALLDGQIGFVGVSGEFSCGHALALRRRARMEHLFFLGYCNDYQQYFPTIEAAAEGGYGTQGAVAPAEIGAGERVMDRALIALYRMRGRLP